MPVRACVVRRVRALSVATWLAFTGATHEAGAVDPSSLPAVQAPDAPVVAYARSRGINLDRLEFSDETGPSAPGDRVTALITLRDKRRVLQWLSRFEVSALSPLEQQQVRLRFTTLRSQSGHEYSFSATPSLALNIRTVGPFSGGRSTPKEKEARTIVSPDFLALGFDRAADAILVMKSRPKGTPVPEEQERAALGTIPAFVGLLETVQSTPGLRDIMYHVIGKPSVWSFLKRNASRMNVEIRDASVPPAPDDTFLDTPVRTLNVNIKMNDSPALNCVIYVTSPRPPLLATAGIFRIVATSPKREDVQLEVRVLAAELGARRE